MANSRTILSIFSLICSWAMVASSAEGDSMSCIEGLLPCQAYLKATSPPPAVCCVPLKKIVADERECLCAVFNNQDILKSFNVTQDDALNVAKLCGAHADRSLCRQAAAPSGSASTPAAHSPSTHVSAPSPSPKKNAASAMYNDGGSLGLAAILSFVVIAF